MSCPFGRRGPQARPLAATVAFRLCASTLDQPRQQKYPPWKCREYSLHRPVFVILLQQAASEAIRAKTNGWRPRKIEAREILTCLLMGFLQNKANFYGILSDISGHTARRHHRFVQVSPGKRERNSAFTVAADYQRVRHFPCRTSFHAPPHS